MPRVISGDFGGRLLAVPPSARPTVDRVKEAVFSSLGPMYARCVLDAYAGSGALAIEAISRGAKHAVIAESDGRACKIIRQNLEALGMSDKVTLVEQPVQKFFDSKPSLDCGPFDFVFADPPYEMDICAVETLLQTLLDQKLLALDCRIMLEREKRNPGPLFTNAEFIKEKKYGDTIIRYFNLGEIGKADA